MRQSFYLKTQSSNFQHVFSCWRKLLRAACLFASCFKHYKLSRRFREKPIEKPMSKRTSPLGATGRGDCVLSLWCAAGIGDSHATIKPHGVCCGGLIFDFEPIVLRNSLKSCRVVLCAFHNRFSIPADPEQSFCGGVVSKYNPKAIVHTWNLKHKAHGQTSNWGGFRNLEKGQFEMQTPEAVPSRGVRGHPTLAKFYWEVGFPVSLRPSFRDWYSFASVISSIYRAFS